MVAAAHAVPEPVLALARVTLPLAPKAPCRLLGSTARLLGDAASSLSCGCAASTGDDVLAVAALMIHTSAASVSTAGQLLPADGVAAAELEERGTLTCRPAVTGRVVPRLLAKNEVCTGDTLPGGGWGVTATGCDTRLGERTTANASAGIDTWGRTGTAVVGRGGVNNECAGAGDDVAALLRLAPRQPVGVSLLGERCCGGRWRCTGVAVVSPPPPPPVAPGEVELLPAAAVARERTETRRTVTA